MKKIVISSAQEDVGKTTTIIGMGKRLGKKIGYFKPFGDRIYYHKKRLWDYDSVAVARALGIKESPDELSIGFEHSRLMYMYDDKSIKQKIQEIFNKLSTEKDMVFVEGSKNLIYGTSVHLDSFSVARHLESPMLLVLSGSNEEIFDGAIRCRELAEYNSIELIGAIINICKDLEDWTETYAPRLEKQGLKVLGIIPEIRELSMLTAEFVSDQLFAKILAGEKGLSNTVENIFIGAMSVSAAIKNPLFGKKKKLLITSGDRTDMILAALEENTSCIVLTNNIIPPARICEMAEERAVPLLLVPWDTYTTVKRVENIKPWLSERDEHKMKAIIKAFRHLDISWL